MLEICKSLFESLNSSNVRYCHWKSNIRLSKSLNGETDLDLLIQIDDKEKFERILQEFTVKRIKSPTGKRYSGLEDYLGFDYDTGKLIHIHAHYKLVLGQLYIKNHHLPIEELFFQNLIIKNNVFVPCPEVELILLVIRANMKVDNVAILKHAVKNLLGRRYVPYPKDIEHEFNELIRACSMKRVKELVFLSNLPLTEGFFTRFFAKFVDKELNVFDVLRMRKQVLSAMRDYRCDKSIRIIFKYYALAFRNLPFIRKCFKSKGKTLENNGIVFSIVGSDGSGKSTLVGELKRWLSWKLDVKGMYYGIPKTNFVKYVTLVIRGFQKFHINVISTFLNNCLWISIARARFHVYTESQRCAAKGKPVITDRFPLREFWGMHDPMDGPRIDSQIGSFSTLLSRIEMSYYNRIQLPDHVYVLQANIEELRKRKTDLDVVTHRKKAQAVNSIKGSVHIHLIDANRPYSEVILDLKRNIWKTL